jgi:hypothetical protein
MMRPVAVSVHCDPPHTFGAPVMLRAQLSAGSTSTMIVLFCMVGSPTSLGAPTHRRMLF